MMKRRTPPPPLPVSESAKFTIYAALYERRPALSKNTLFSCVLCVFTGILHHHDWTDVACILIGSGIATWLIRRHTRAMKKWRAAMIAAWTALGPEPDDRHFYSPRGES